MRKQKLKPKTSLQSALTKNCDMRLFRPSKPGTLARVQNGTIVRVGDWVQFKWDEQNGGRITEIKQNYGGEVLTLENKYGYVGDMFGGKTSIRIAAHECWSE